MRVLLEGLTNEKGHLGIIPIEQVEEVICVQVWTIVKREGYGTRFSAVIDSDAIWNTPELRSCSARR